MTCPAGLPSEGEEKWFSSKSITKPSWHTDPNVAVAERHLSTLELIYHALQSKVVAADSPILDALPLATSVLDAAYEHAKTSKYRENEMKDEYLAQHLLAVVGYVASYHSPSMQDWQSGYSISRISPPRRQFMDQEGTPIHFQGLLDDVKAVAAD
jgi:hypothetical protein